MKKLLIIIITICFATSGCSSKKEISKITVNTSYIYVAVGETDNSLIINTSPDKNGELNYEIENPSIASVSEDGAVKGKKQGSTVMKISAKDNNKVRTSIKIYTYPLKVLNKNPYKIQWQWKAAYRVNDFAAKKTGKSSRSIRDDIIQKSFSYLGKGYSQVKRYGPTYDCSSLIAELYKKNYSVDIGTYTRAQIAVLKDYKIDFSKKQIGDIIFGTDGTDNHVGIYLGNNRMLHSANSLKGVSVSSIYYGPFAPVK